MADADRVINWIMRTDDAKKYDIVVKEFKMFGISLYKKITIFKNPYNTEIVKV